MIDARERAIFERIKTVLTEIGTLQDDLAELKLEAEKAAGLTKERIGDLVAVARRQVMDAAVREKKEAAERRRAELDGQLSLALDAKPRHAPPLEPGKVWSQQPEGHYAETAAI